MSDDRIGSYPTVFAIGHSAILDIFNDSVIVEEKIDGSQFSFGMVGGELLCRSKGKQIVIDAPEKMFGRAVESVLARKERLHPDWIYRCEYLEKPHHNTLCYERRPIDHLIGFDIATGIETYLTHEEKKDEFERIGLECVPLLCEGRIGGVGDFLALLDKDILFEHFWTKISRGVIAGSPEWYKEQLLQAAFEQRQAASLPLEGERDR